MTEPSRGKTPRPEPPWAGDARSAMDALDASIGELRAWAATSGGAMERADDVAGAVERALRALRALCSTCVESPHAVERLDEACACMHELADSMVALDDSPPGRLGQRVSAAARSLTRRRDELCDYLPSLRSAAARSHAGDIQRGAPDGVASPAPRSSVGVPRVQPLGPESFGSLLRLYAAAAPGRLVKPERPEGSPPLPADGQLRSLARECLSCLGITGMLCHLEGDRPWSPAVGDFEQRLLDNLDAFFSLSGAGAQAPAGDGGLADRTDVVEVLIDFVSEVPGDANRAFVQSFVLGCIDAEESLRTAVALLRRAAPPTHRSHARALALAPSAHVGPAMARLCRDAEPRVLSLALDVLWARGEARFAEVATLLAHPEAAVRCSAARALSTTDERSAAAELVAYEIVDEVDDDVVAVLAETLLLLDDRRGLETVRSRLLEECELPGALSRRARGALMRQLALAGDSSDLPTMLALAELPQEVELLGWFGHPGVVEPLLHILEEPAPPEVFGAGETRPLAAARALQRITSAMEEGSAPRGFGARPDAASPDPHLWRAWWQAHRDGLPRTTKLRSSEPFRLEHCLDELERPGVPQDVRECAVLELALLSGATITPWLGDWYPRCRQRLQQWRELVRHHTGAAHPRLHAPGEWPSRRLGQRVRAVHGT